ncbi:MAG: cytochrome D1 domain-containing protein [Myxococcota bacterium]
MDRTERPDLLLRLRLRGFGRGARLLVAALLVACQHAGTRVFVANSGDGTVSVVDHELEHEIRVLPVGLFPQGLALRSDPPLLAVASSHSGSVSLIDPLTLEVVRKEIRVGRFPTGLAFSTDGGRLYVANYDGRSVSVIDVARGEVLGEAIDVPGKPLRLAISGQGRQLFVLLHQKAGGVAVVDTATQAVTRTIAVDPFPSDLALRPGGKRLFVASFNGDSVAEIDLESLETTRVLDIDTGHGLLVHPTRPLLYSLVSFDDEVLVYDYERGHEVARIPVGQSPVYSALTPDGRFLYVVNSSDSNLMKIDTETNRVLLRIAVGVEPADAICFDP